MKPSSIKKVLFAVPFIFATCSHLMAESHLINDQPRSAMRAGYDLTQCTSLLEECMRVKQDTRASCLNSTSEHLFCAGGQLGKLAKQRSQMASSPDFAQESTPAVVVVDQSCLEKFDNHFLARLIRGSMDKKTIDELSGALGICANENERNILRP